MRFSVVDERLLHLYLVSQGLISSDTLWYNQHGGMTNKVWRIIGEKDLICKLYLDTKNNPMFDNNPIAEYNCLLWLEGANIAPKAYESLQTPFGYVLLYYYIEGKIWNKNVDKVSDLIQRVHSHKPLKELRTISGLPKNIRQYGMKMLNKLEDPYGEEILQNYPNVSFTQIEPVLIHTDVVAGNLIDGEDGLRLIDWQCPALGDPIFDISMFLSPAMHKIYGIKTFTISDFDNFLKGFSSQIRERYYLIGPLYHWRLAAYCLWKAEQGINEYEGAANLEIDLLKIFK